MSSDEIINIFIYKSQNPKLRKFYQKISTNKKNLFNLCNSHFYTEEKSDSKTENFLKYINIENTDYFIIVNSYIEYMLSSSYKNFSLYNTNTTKNLVYTGSKQLTYFSQETKRIENLSTPSNKTNKIIYELVPINQEIKNLTPEKDIDIKLICDFDNKSLSDIVQHIINKDRKYRYSGIEDTKDLIHIDNILLSNLNINNENIPIIEPLEKTKYPSTNEQFNSTFYNNFGKLFKPKIYHTQENSSFFLSTVFLDWFNDNKTRIFNLLFEDCSTLPNTDNKVIVKTAITQYIFDFVLLDSVDENTDAFDAITQLTNDPTVPILYRRIFIDHDDIFSSKTYIENKVFFELLFNSGFINNINLTPFDFSNILIAGGSITNTLLDTKNTNDIDMFIYGLDEKQAIEKLNYIYDYFKRFNVSFVYSKNCFSFITKFEPEEPTDNEFEKEVFKIDVVLRLYKTKSEILHGFDIGSAAIGFDGKDVYTTTLGKFALQYKYNIIDTTRRSTTYEVRLSKYFYRGFGIILPNLSNNSKTIPSILEHYLTTYYKGHYKYNETELKYLIESIILKKLPKTPDIWFPNKCNIESTIIKKKVKKQLKDLKLTDDIDNFINNLDINFDDYINSIQNNSKQFLNMLQELKLPNPLPNIKYVLNHNKYMKDVINLEQKSPVSLEKINDFVNELFLSRNINKEIRIKNPYFVMKIQNKYILKKIGTNLSINKNYNSDYCSSFSYKNNFWYIFRDNNQYLKCSTYLKSISYYLTLPLNKFYKSSDEIDKYNKTILKKIFKIRRNFSDYFNKHSKHILGIETIIFTKQYKKLVQDMRNFYTFFDNSISELKENGVIIDDIGYYLDFFNKPLKQILNNMKNNINPTLDVLQNKILTNCSNIISTQLTLLPPPTNWITQNPGTQLTSSINPIIEDEREWYGSNYNKNIEFSDIKETKQKETKQREISDTSPLLFKNKSKKSFNRKPKKNNNKSSKKK